MRGRKTVRVLVLIAAVIAAAIFLLPWQTWLQKKLITAIANKGISPASLTIDSIGFKSLELKDVSLGEPALKLAHLTLAYSPRQLLNGTIEDIKLTGLALIATQTEEDWSLAGFDPLLRSKSTTTEPTRIALPVTRADLAALPFRSVEISDSTIQATTSTWQIAAPIHFLLQNKEVVEATLESDAISASQGESKLSSGKFKASLKLDEAKQQWHGVWSIEDMNLTSEIIALPKLKAEGDLTITTDTITLNGTFKSANNSHHAAFKLTYAMNESAKSTAVIEQAAMPWGGGAISISKARIPLAAKKPITLNLNVQQMAIDTLMQALTSNRATATGVVSGSVPITIASGGEVSFGKGLLKAEAPGTIALSPEAIPGDNQQVALVREVLKNLHYNLLSLELEMAPDKTLSALLAVEGSNPEVQNGRAIKLKVHLSGDLLNLIKQNVKLMTDPKTFIEQEIHDTN